MNYKTLTINDIRQDGDEVRSLFTVNPGSAGPVLAIYGATESDVTITKADLIAKFRPCTLRGQRILASDLIHLEYRRPMK